TGSTTINGGTLKLGISNALSSSTKLIFANTAGAIFNLNGNTQTSSGLSGGGKKGSNVSLGAGTLTLTEGTTETYAGILSGTGNFTLGTGSTGTLTLSGNNTYTGSTTINGGTLKLGISNALSSSTTLIFANTASAIFNLNDNTQT